MSDDVEFGSRNEHWHPGETPEYIAEAVVRVRERLNMPHARDLTMSTATAPQIASTPLDPAAAHRLAEAFRAHLAYLRLNWRSSDSGACVDCGGPVWHPSLDAPEPVPVMRRRSPQYRCSRCAQAGKVAA